MTKTQFMQKTGVWKRTMSYRSWDESKNPCPCGNHTFPSSVQHQNLESTQPATSCFPGTDDVPREMCDFCTGIGSWNTPQLHTKMCLAGISRHAHNICDSSLLRVRHFALFWSHDKEEKYSSCPNNVILLAQI